MSSEPTTPETVSEPLAVQMYYDSSSGAPIYSTCDADVDDNDASESDDKDEQVEDEELEAMLQGWPPIHEPVRTDPWSIEGYGLKMTLTPPPPDNDDRYVILDWYWGTNTLYLMNPPIEKRGDDSDMEDSLLKSPLRMRVTGKLADQGDAVEWGIPYMYLREWLHSMDRKVEIKDKREMLEAELRVFLDIEW